MTLPGNAYPNCALVDVNSDHKPDLVCPAVSNQALLLTLLGNGDGTFQSPITGYQASAVPSATQFDILNSADLNGDGYPDLIVTDIMSLTTVSALLGDGTGHFTFKYKLPVGPSTFDTLTIADVNGDGKPDIVRSFGPDVLLGNGDGTFTPLNGPSLNPSYGGCILKKDIDGDGHLDAVCLSGTSRFSILHGNADGSFNTSSPLATITVTNPHDVLQPADVEDLNHDGILDIITYSNEGMMVWFGKPGLQYQLSATYTVGTIDYTNQRLTILADANGDGITDVLTSGVDGVYVSYGRSDGTFDASPAVPSGLSVSRATVADFNRDGIADVVTSDPLGLNISLGRLGGNFTPSVTIPSAPINLVYTAPFPLLHGDFDGDGNQDLVVQGTMSNNVSPQGYFMHGNGDGTFATPVEIPYVVGGEPATIGTNSSVADLNHDGRDDLISADRTFIHTRISLPGGGFSSTFASPIPAEVAVGTFPPFTVGDFDGDGIPDVVPGLKNIYFLHGKGDGTFAAPGPAITVPQTSGYVTAISSADFDQDGKLDLAVLEQFTQSPFRSLVFIYYGNGDGTFAPPATLLVSDVGLAALNIADFNRDGLPDLLLSCGNFYSCTPAQGMYPITIFQPLYIFHSLANRTFSQSDLYIGGTLPSDTAVADVSGDGYPDIILANGSQRGNAFVPLLNAPTVPIVIGTLTASPEPTLVNQPFTLTAILIPPIPTPLAGTVSFTLDGTALGSSPVTSNGATFTVSTPVPRGNHRIMATWSGDTNYPAGAFLFGFHTVTGYPVSLPFTSSANPVFFGQQFNLQYSVSNAASVPSTIPQPTGTFALTDNGFNLFSPLAVNGGLGGSTSFGNGLAPAGQHTLVASYSGDSLHEPASVTIVENVNPVASTTSLQTFPSPSIYGQTVRLTATVTIPTGNHSGLLLTSPPPTVTFTGLPGGPITIPALINLAASTPTSTVATATYIATALPTGTYNITGTYSGSVNTQSSTSAVNHIVQPAPTTTTLTASPTTAYQHQAINLSASVAGVLATPTGTIRFLDGNNPLFTTTLVAGSATFATSQLSPGIHTITAIYSGDAGNQTSTSSAVTVTILSSDFTLSFNPSSLSLVAGHHTTLTLTATSVGNFADTIRLNATNLPQWVTIRFTPAELKLTSGSNTTASVYIDTDAVIGYLGQANPSSPRTPGISAIAASALALILAPITVRRRRLAALLTLTIAAALLTTVSGCAGKYPDSTAPGTYTLQITATGAQTGLTRTINLPLTVTK
jgi:hypothetical protein